MREQSVSLRWQIYVRSARHPGATLTPDGNSYGTVSIGSNGVVKLTGYLADKTSIAKSVPSRKTASGRSSFRSLRARNFDFVDLFGGPSDG